MPLINCPECGKENISDQAENCPSCGFPIKAHFAAVAEATQRLKYPADSVFQNESDMIVSKSGSTYTVTGYVDAGNAYGAKERKYFTVVVELTSVNSDNFGYKVKSFKWES